MKEKEKEKEKDKEKEPGGRRSRKRKGIVSSITLLSTHKVNLFGKGPIENLHLIRRKETVGFIRLDVRHNRGVMNA